MDSLNYECTSFSPYSSIGQLCEYLNKIAGYGIYYDTFRRLPSELIFAQCVLKTRLSSLTYGIVRINKRVAFITNQVLTSKYDCVFDLFAYELHFPQQLANCKLFAQSCSKHRICDYYRRGTLYCTKRSHRVLQQTMCPCKLCVKIVPPSLKSLC